MERPAVARPIVGQATVEGVGVGNLAKRVLLDGREAMGCASVAEEVMSRLAVVKAAVVWP